MLHHPTLDKLQTLKLTGMIAALKEQMQHSDIDELGFEERLGLLVDRELTERDSRQLSNRLKRAKLKHQAAIEDVDYQQPRGLDKSLIQTLSTSRWVKEHLNILITGSTGVGKTWFACAFAHKACRDGYSAHYHSFITFIGRTGHCQRRWALRETTRPACQNGCVNHR